MEMYFIKNVFIYCAAAFFNQKTCLDTHTFERTSLHTVAYFVSKLCKKLEIIGQLLINIILHIMFHNYKMDHCATRYIPF